MHWYQNIKRMSDTKKTPTIPMQSPHKATYGVLPLRLCQFQPIRNARKLPTRVLVHCWQQLVANDKVMLKAYAF